MPPEYYFAAIAILIVLGLLAFTLIGNQPRRRVLRKSAPRKSVLRAPTQNNELVARLERIEHAIKLIEDHLQISATVPPGTVVPTVRRHLDRPPAALQEPFLPTASQHAESESPSASEDQPTSHESQQPTQTGDEPKKHHYVRLSMFGR